MKKHITTIIISIVFFSMCLVDICAKDKEFSSLENRNLSKKPKFTISSLFNGSYIKKYESYIDDQFLFRDNFINLKSNLEYIQGKAENNNILYGKNNRLFEKIIKIDENRINENIKAIDILSKNVDIRINFLLVPNSSEIYKEDMPYGSYVINQEEGINKIYNFLKYTNNIDILDTLKENKNKYIYYNTDHHWTSYGAYLAYEKLCENLDLVPTDIEKLIKKDINNFLGTYFLKSKNFNITEDTLSYYEFNNIEMVIDNTVYNSLYDYEKILEVDKYSLFLRGNNNLTVIKNKNLNSNKKILIIKDSYANCFAPFLTGNFEEIHVIDLRSFSPKISEYINNNTFDEILILYNYNTFIKETSIIKVKY